MADPVKTDRRAARTAETEARLVAAATQLFLEHGYAATALTAVAEAAGLAPRTVYVRFATKAELLRRCIGAAIAGDLTEVPIGERAWIVEATTAPTLAERIERMATGTAALMDRAGALLGVAQQAAAIEPEIAALAQAGRDDTRRTLLDFWSRAAADGLLPEEADLDWLAETAALVAQAETYVLARATTDWSIDAYRAWLTTTWTRLVAASGPAASPTGGRRAAPRTRA